MEKPEAINGKAEGVETAITSKDAEVEKPKSNDLPEMMVKRIQQMINAAANGVYNQLQLYVGTKEKPNRAVRILVVPDLMELPEFPKNVPGQSQKEQ